MIGFFRTIPGLLASRRAEPTRNYPNTVAFRGILSPCKERNQGVAPSGDGLGNLGLFAGIHVVGALDHGRVHATGAARLTLDAGRNQLQIRLGSNIVPRAEEGEDRTANARDGRIRCSNAEEVSEFRGAVDAIQECSRADNLLSVGRRPNFPAFSSGPGGGRGWDRSLARGRTD